MDGTWSRSGYETLLCSMLQRHRSKWTRGTTLSNCIVALCLKAKNVCLSWSQNKWHVFCHEAKTCDTSSVMKPKHVARWSVMKPKHVTRWSVMKPKHVTCCLSWSHNMWHVVCQEAKKCGTLVCQEAKTCCALSFMKPQYVARCLSWSQIMCGMLICQEANTCGTLSVMKPKHVALWSIMKPKHVARCSIMKPNSGFRNAGICWHIHKFSKFATVLQQWRVVFIIEYTRVALGCTLPPVWLVPTAHGCLPD